MKKLLLPLLALAMAAPALGLMFPAQAVQYDWTAHYGSVNNIQEFHYNRELGGKIRMVNKRDNASPLYCIDMRLDWDTAGTGTQDGHYDTRILRNCAQNATTATDPNGNGWWEEGWNDTSDTNGIRTYDPNDSDWWNINYDRNIAGMGEAGVFVINDGTLKVEQELVWQGGSRLGLHDAPTQNGGNSRVRTLYQDGHLDSTDPYCTENQQQASASMNQCDRTRLPRLTASEDLQAAYVTIAWRNNGAYSECMTERGYNVPWQDAIGLAPALRDDPELVDGYERRQDNMTLERRVVPGAEFAEAVGECRDANPPLVSDDEMDTLKTTLPTAKTLRIARKHGWNRTDPFARTPRR